jgi:hypothetical protein
MDFYSLAESVGTVAAVGVAAVAAVQAKKAAQKSNDTATKLAVIEEQPRHSELCPRLRVICQPWSPGATEHQHLRLRVMLLGPPTLDRLDRLTVTIRDDHHRRGATPLQQIVGGPTPEQIQHLIWSPYRLAPGIGPDGFQADSRGRSVVYDAVLPLGEELPFQLDRTLKGFWMNMSEADWQRDRGTLLRIAFTAEHKAHGTWVLPCEIETPSKTVHLPQVDGGSTATAGQNSPA